MNPKVKANLEKIESEYGHIDTILVFGSAITSEWTEKSDIDIFLIDNSFHDSRSEKTIDGITVEFQEDSFDTIKHNMEAERGNLLHRNLSNMIATSEPVSTKSPAKLAELKSLADDILISAPNYDDEDAKMWRYSILDYLAKAEKDIARNDAVAFYIDAHYVLQNALELSLATHDTYMPQPKHLAKLLAEKDPELLEIWQKYLTATDLKSKLSILSKLNAK
ncbi:nucleotidyltransferase domain-containing protein [Candidatus Saccharibacteria bacterium]|nr:nucleotidyltransferase domain-containing protein [Candidatus Saccharibacteria bacterium]